MLLQPVCYGLFGGQWCGSACVLGPVRWPGTVQPVCCAPLGGQTVMYSKCNYGPLSGQSLEYSMWLLPHE